MSKRGGKKKKMALSTPPPPSSAWQCSSIPPRRTTPPPPSSATTQLSHRLAPREGILRGKGFKCTGGLMSADAVALLRSFYEQGNPNAPKPHRPVRVLQP